MAITGNLRTMQLSELLQWLSMGQKTGTLVVRGTAGEKRIYFQGGRIISSSSTIEREYLGHFLVAFGYITEEELTRAMEVQEESKILLGKILVMIGAIQEEELTDLIKLKAAETIYDIFLWTEGAFEFIDGEIPKMPMVPISADVTGIVMEGLRRYDEWQRIRTKIPSTKEVPALTGPVAFDQLPDRERLILQAIDGQRSIVGISNLTHNPEFHVAKFIFELMESGLISIVATAHDEPIPEPEPDPFETVFAEAEGSPFELPLEPAPPTFVSPPLPQVPLEPPPPIATPSVPAQDFSRFLRRGPDSAGADGGRSASRAPGDRSGSTIAAPSQALPMATSASVPWGSSPSMAAVAPPAPAPPAQAPPPPPVPPPSQIAVPQPVSAPVTIQIAPSAVPKLIKPMEELMTWSFTPNEAFIVSRINGLWDVRSIAKISPFPEIEVLRVFQRLHAGGVIAWR